MDNDQKSYSTGLGQMEIYLFLYNSVKWFLKVEYNGYTCM